MRIDKMTLDEMRKASEPKAVASIMLSVPPRADKSSCERRAQPTPQNNVFATKNGHQADVARTESEAENRSGKNLLILSGLDFVCMIF